MQGTQITLSSDKGCVQNNYTHKYKKAIFHTKLSEMKNMITKIKNLTGLEENWGKLYIEQEGKQRFLKGRDIE